MGPGAGTGCAPLPSSCTGPTTTRAPRSRRSSPGAPGMAHGPRGHLCRVLRPREPGDRGAGRPPKSRRLVVIPPRPPAPTVLPGSILLLLQQLKWLFIICGSRGAPFPPLLPCPRGSEQAAFSHRRQMLPTGLQILVAWLG